MRKTPTRTGPETLLIKPVSGRCNLRCDYCFYRPVHSSIYPDARTMTGDVLSEMIRRYLSLGLATSGFSWQGGEPTLAGLDFFKEAVSLMMRHGRGGQSVSNSIQTNGVLLDDAWAEFLARYSFLVGVSVDGPKWLHELHRPGSYDRAIAGAEACRKHGVEVNALAVLNRDSEGRAKEIYQSLREQGFDHFQFIPCIDDVPFAIRPEAYGDFLIELFDLWRADDERGERISIRLFDAITRKLIQGASGYCFISPMCGEYMVVEHNGDLFPCDFYVDPAVKVGNVLTDDIGRAFDSIVMRRFGKQRLVRPDKCRSCRHWKICFGGCLRMREAGGGIDKPTFLCEGFRRFFDHALPELERRARRLCPS